MISPFGIEALVVNNIRRGPHQMAGMGEGNPILDIADALTGGKVTSTQEQLNRLELALKISIGASIVAGTLALVTLLSGKR